jgi:alpha-L-fucosidase
LLITEPYGHHMQGSVATENDLNLRLPVTKPNVEIPVIELFLN